MVKNELMLSRSCTQKVDSKHENTSKATLNLIDLWFYRLSKFINEEIISSFLTVHFFLNHQRNSLGDIMLVINSVGEFFPFHQHTFWPTHLFSPAVVLTVNVHVISVVTIIQRNTTHHIIEICTDIFETVIGQYII